MMPDYTKEFYEEGYKISLNNSQRLLKIAELSANEGAFGIACSLSILSAEEAVKSILLLIKFLKPEVEINDFEKLFKDHSMKHGHLKTFLAINRLSMRQREDQYEKHKDILKKLELLPVELQNKYKEKFKVLFKEFEWTEKQKKYNTNLEEGLNWWGNANSQKNKGLYVGKDNSTWLNPEIFTRENYLEAKKHADAIIDYVDIFKESIEILNITKYSKKT